MVVRGRSNGLQIKGKSPLSFFYYPLFSFIKLIQNNTKNNFSKQFKQIIKNSFVKIKKFFIFTKLNIKYSFSKHKK